MSTITPKPPPEATPARSAVARVSVVTVAPLSIRKRTGRPLTSSVDPEMAVAGAADAQLAALHLLARLAAQLGQHAAAERPEIVAQREHGEADAEDQHPGERHLERLADRRAAHGEAAADQDEQQNKINEAKGLVAVAHNSTSIPS